MTDSGDQQFNAIEAHNQEVIAKSRKYTRRSMTVAALSAAAGYAFCRWVFYSTAEGDQPMPRRRAYQANAELSRMLFHERGMAPTYDVSRAEEPRTNGYIGIKQDLIADTWRLQLVGVENAMQSPRYVSDVTAWEYAYLPASDDDATSEQKLRTDQPLRERAGKLNRGLEEAGLSRSTLSAGTAGLLLTVDDILKLPRHELVTEFKCIEGWSQIIQWGGIRMADFIDAYPPAKKPDGSLPRYVYMETPNGDYYVGYDLDVCRHPQTLLVTEMAGKPLTQRHGAPLRLHAPTKYGYKQIKRIGLIVYTDLKPDDYWTKLGYDWYAGL
jgi:DMSO/TMAO reductase YedYZ molybdopterin-dependent catalytic subunit